MLYHIVPQDDWKSQSNLRHYLGESLNTEGFIHLSQAHQLNSVLNRFYRAQSGLLLLHIDESRLIEELRFEDSYGEGQQYPHLYGPLNINAIVLIEFLVAEKNGCYHWPQPK